MSRDQPSQSGVTPASHEPGGSEGGAARAFGGQTRASVIARLERLTRSGHFLFGQQNATLWGMYMNGHLVSTGAWFDATARAGRFTSDSAAVVGDDPAVLGVGLDMLAFEPVEWNRRAVVARAIGRQMEQGGIVTLDWHAPSCDANPEPAEPARAPLGRVTVGGQSVDIRPAPRGAWFYADEGYKRPIASRADVPDALKCVCQIANDLPISAGPYAGLRARDWLVAHATYAAEVLREQGLANAPVIVRPFHEHTGSWFWWGQPYWNCAALLGRPGATSGPEAYKQMARLFVATLRAQPGMGELLFAYSPDKLQSQRAVERLAPSAADKLADPEGFARDRLRERLVRELGAAGLAYVSTAAEAALAAGTEAGATGAAAVGTGTDGVSPPGERARSNRRGRASAVGGPDDVARLRRYYVEAYAGDDVFDVLGIDLYHPMGRPANRGDLRRFGVELRALAEEARARGKPYALTEAGTYRLQLAQLAHAAPKLDPPGVVLHDARSVTNGLARLFDPADRAALLRHFGLSVAGPVVLDVAERRALLPPRPEDWFERQLLVMAKRARVAYAMVWQTYFDSGIADRYFNYYVPYPGHPDAPSFQRFYADPATCFLRDDCER